MDNEAATATSSRHASNHPKTAAAVDAPLDAVSMSDASVWSAYENFDLPYKVDFLPYDWCAERSVELAPYEHAALRLSLDKWIHLRYCAVYSVHDWVHFGFVRGLLYSAFCSTMRFPSRTDVAESLSIAIWLSRRLHSDIVEEIHSSLVTASTALLWQTIMTVHIPQVTGWSAEERALSSIFTDAFYMRGQLPYELYRFLEDPMGYFPDARDILALPLIYKSSYEAALDLSLQSLPLCTCGECAQIELQLRRTRNGAFRNHYLAILERSSNRGCTAISDVLETMVQSAEDWLEQLMGRIESSSTIFQLESGERLGPLVCEVVEPLNITVGDPLTTDRLLKLATTLALSCNKHTAVLCPELPADGLGYAVEVEDRDQSLHAILYVRGGWLYDLADSSFDAEYGSVTVLSPSEELSFDCIGRPLYSGIIRSVCMPTLIPDDPLSFPLRHTDGLVRVPNGPNPGPATIVANRPQFQVHTSIVISQKDEVGFPSLLPVKPKDNLRWASVLLRMSYCDRMLETAWRPSVETGSRCPHTNKYRVMTHCSCTSVDIIMQIEPSYSELRGAGRFPDSDLTKLVKLRDSTSCLTGRGRVLERGRVCIVRCGGEDGPPEPIVLLAGSIGKKVYVFHHQECWDCAVGRMRDRGCTIGLAVNTKIVISCPLCQREG